MTTIAHDRHNNLHVLLVISENLFETVAQVVEVRVLRNLRLEDSRLDCIGDGHGLRTKQVFRALAVSCIEERTCISSGLGREHINRRGLALHAALGLSLVAGLGFIHAPSQELFAASVGLVDILAVVVVVFTGDQIFVQSKAAIVGQAILISLRRTETSFRSVVYHDWVFF